MDGPGFLANSKNADTSTVQSSGGYRAIGDIYVISVFRHRNGDVSKAVVVVSSLGIVK